MRNAASGAALDPEIEKRLRRIFAEPNRELEFLLGRSFPWDA
jgi:hypothetical protein